jgi:hypothetical protein
MSCVSHEVFTFFIHGRVMAQTVSLQSLTMEAQVRARVCQCGICGEKVALGQVFLRVLQFSLSIIFHRGSPHSYITWGVNNRPVSGRSSETVSPHRHEYEQT